MAAEQNMTQATTQAVIDAPKAVITAIRKADNPVNNARPIHTTQRSSNPVLKTTHIWLETGR